MEKILYQGKSKIVCEGPDQSTYIIRYKDTATAFNGEKKEELNGKAELNAAITDVIYNYLNLRGIKTHYLSMLDERTILAKRARIIPVEVIVRNLAAGGFSKKYGVAEGTSLLNTVIEFSYKSDELGDPMINESQITAIGLATNGDITYMKEQAFNINELLVELFLKVGIRLVDFKLEFGVADGEIILCDEISPDSCRLWDLVTDEKMDKDRFRRDLGNVMEGYAEVLRRLKDVK